MRMKLMLTALLLGGLLVPPLWSLAQSQRGQGVRHEIHRLNGTPALLSWQGDTLISASWIDEDETGISAIHALRHPGKLARLAAVTKSAGPASLH